MESKEKTAGREEPRNKEGRGSGEERAFYISCGSGTSYGQDGKVFSMLHSQLCSKLAFWPLPKS